MEKEHEKNKTKQHALKKKKAKQKQNPQTMQDGVYEEQQRIERGKFWWKGHQNFKTHCEVLKIKID